MAVLRFLISTWTGKAIIGVVAVALVGGTVIAPRLVSSQPAPTVRTATVSRGNVTQTVAVSGSLNAFAVYKMGFKVTGAKLADVPVKVGQAVTIGTVLGKLDTTDFDNAVRQAGVNLTSAQAKYDQIVAGASAEDIAIARSQVDTAQTSFDLTQQSTQTDMANAQQGLTKVKTAYASAKDSWAAATSGIQGDADSYQKAISPLAQKALGIRGALQERGLTGGDVTGARNSLISAETAFGQANALAGTSLAPALAEYTNAANNVWAALGFFDRLLDGGDTSEAARAYQSAQTALQTASTHLTGALDAVAAQIATGQTAVVAAQTSLNTGTTLADPSLEQERLDAAALVAAVSSEQQTGTTLKARTTQASTALATLSDVVGGSYVNALQAVQGAKDKATQSITSQQNALRSAQLSFNKTSASPKATDIAVALASVQLAQLAVDKAKQDLDNATLRAPVDGVVSAVANGVGETPGNPYVTIAVVSSVILHGTVGESDIAKIRAGQVATVTVDAIGAGTRLTGKVTALDPIATISQGVPVYGVDVTIDLTDPSVRPGMSGTAAVIIASQQGVLTVPNLAIRTTGGQRSIQVMRNGVAEDAQVAFGISNETVTEIKSGLAEGDTVVIPAARPSSSARPQQFGPGGGGGPVRIGG